MRHLLSIADLSKVEALQILNTAEELARVSDGPMKKLPTLRGRTRGSCRAMEASFSRLLHRR